MNVSESELKQMLSKNDSLAHENPRLLATVISPGKTHTVAYLAEQYEHDIQAAVIAWARANEGRYPALELLYAVPNGGYRHPATAAQMQREGQRPGVPDLVLPVARTMDDGTRYNALYVELKRKDGKVSDAQQAMIAKLQRYGNLACVCFGAQDAIDTLEWYVKEGV